MSIKEKIKFFENKINNNDDNIIKNKKLKSNQNKKINIEKHINFWNKTEYAFGRHTTTKIKKINGII